MQLQADVAPPATAHRGFVLGELFVAIFLLAIAISSVTALMYSVTRNPRHRTEVECSDKGAAGLPKCAAPAKSAAAKAAPTKPASAAKLLVAGCATRSGARVQACKDSVQGAESPDALTLRSRTDSASLQLLPPKKTKRAPRPDLGFVR